MQEVEQAGGFDQVGITTRCLCFDSLGDVVVGSGTTCPITIGGDGTEERFGRGGQVAGEASAHTRYAGTLGSRKVWRCRQCTRTFWPMTPLIGTALPGIGRKSESNAPPELRILVRRRGSFAQALAGLLARGLAKLRELLRDDK
jgi:hypothetical protein